MQFGRRHSQDRRSKDPHVNRFPSKAFCFLGNRTPNTLLYRLRFDRKSAIIIDRFNSLLYV